MNEDISFDSVDFSSIESVRTYITEKVNNINNEGAPHLEIKDIIIKIFDFKEIEKKQFRALLSKDLNIEKRSFSRKIIPFITGIEESSKTENLRSFIDETFVIDANKNTVITFFRMYKNAVPNFILKVMEIVLKSEIKENQNTTNSNQSESTETAPSTSDGEIEKKPATFEQIVRSDLKKVLKEIKILTNPDPTDSGSTELTINGLIIPGIGILVLVFALLLVFLFYEVYNSNRSAFNKFENLTKQLNAMYTPSTDKDNDSGYLKTQFDKLFKAEISPPKTKDSSLPKTTAPVTAVITESNKGTLSIDEIAPTLKTDLVVLNNKIEALKKIGEKVEVKLDDSKIKEVFNSILKDENSEFGKAIIKINGTGDKKSVVTVDTTSEKNKKELVDLVKNKDRLEKENKGLSDKILEVSTSVSNLKDEVKNKTKEIDKLEAKIKSIADEKTGFKGPAGSYAILLTNSADFQLPSSLLETVFGVLEKQNGISKDVQKIGMYIATGEDISTRYDLRTKIKPKNPTATEPLTGRPTECIIEVGKSFLKYAFDNGKEPAIPIADRKAIIIATLSAKAPKLDSDGWDKITQVEAILIQTPKDKDFREASDWLDFTHKKNGRLVFVQGFDKFAAGSPSLLQLEKHLLTLLNTKKE